LISLRRCWEPTVNLVRHLLMHIVSCLLICNKIPNSN
jgi:hypothetical protein